MDSIKSAISNGLQSLHLSGSAAPATPTFHPLDPLSPAEISLTSATIRAHLAANAQVLKSHKSTYITLLEPEKYETLAYLGISTSPSDPTPTPSGILPARKAESAVIDAVTGEVFLFTVLLKNGRGTVLEQEKLPEGVQPGITMEELTESEEIVRADPKVQKLCADVGITPEQVLCDCWSVGYEDRFGPGRRLQQAFMYARLGPDEHLYAHPLDFNCVVDANAGEVLYIDFASHRVATDGALSGSTVPHDITKDSLVQSGRERIPPPTERFNYLPELLAEEAAKGGKQFSPREGLKPLHLVQPEGVSFTMDGNHLKWQNWDLHIGFNYRDGLALNTVQYFDKDEGRLRPIMYRMSLAEMVVPYASPEWPHPRKFAFDVGEYGLGMMANSLELGCDCLGAIHYLDATMSGHDGEPTILKKCICIHEEDDGLLWKHTDFRTGGRAYAVRSRKLVIQMVVTVANYEYLFAWSLRLDGTIELEVKLTGILNIYTMAEGESAGAFGTEVAPRVMAHHHQHIFCIRLDSMIDGVNNTVVETEVLPMAEPTGSDANWAGNGFYSTKEALETTGDAARSADVTRGRMWSIVNEDKKHYASKAPVGFKIMCSAMIPLLAKEDSLVGRRAPFAKKNLWVTPYEEDKLYPAGKFTTQTLVAPEDSLEGWMKGDKPIRQKDIVSWVTFGVTHLPRPEDFPVMPYEHLTFTLKPVGFFRQNPSLDVPESRDSRSVAALAPVVGEVAEKSCCA